MADLYQYEVTDLCLFGICATVTQLTLPNGTLLISEKLFRVDISLVGAFLNRTKLNHMATKRKSTLKSEFRKSKIEAIPFFTPDVRQCFILGNFDYEAIRFEKEVSAGVTVQ